MNINSELLVAFFETTHIHPEWLCYQILKMLDPKKYSGEDLTMLAPHASTTFYFRDGQNALVGTMKVWENQIIVERYPK